MSSSVFFKRRCCGEGENNPALTFPVQYNSRGIGMGKLSAYQSGSASLKRDQEIQSLISSVYLWQNHMTEEEGALMT